MQEMNPSPNELLANIATAITWVRRRSFQEWQNDQFRSHELMMSPHYEMALEPPNYSASAMRTIVDGVLAKRLALVHSDSADCSSGLATLAGGRLLRHNFGETTFTTEPRDISGGFFDDYDVPAWDIWVAFIVNVENGRGATADYLIAWIPPELLKVVDNAVRASFEENILWLDKSDDHYTRSLPELCWK